ncbi:hypothetical protein [Mycobacterium intracellulare]|uniref:hypothetical protein n=1 Tax=Mycobacterium intracellulare TaxID=1767 RepID=UPI001159734A|nr:hypothetical protein [Mycobacterium intracellulare]
MRVVMGVFLIAIMGCVFTLLTAVVFVTQHLFASAVVAGLLAAAWGAGRRRRRARRTQPRPSYPTSVASAQLPPAGPWTAHHMSSAPLRPRSLAPGTRRCLP